ncbi:MAG TPA: NAD(P)H-hydrate epimerase, partial [Tepidisphaeraceae bacterium]|nr:NAD(P)H-hydrate epimerase [Tepidisphaeraceae bacterium]
GGGLFVGGSRKAGGGAFPSRPPTHTRRCAVTVFHPADPTRFSPDAACMWRTVELMSLTRAVAMPDQIERHRCDLLIDAILGTGPTEPVRPETADLINAVNANPAPRLAIDVPSGLDCDTGQPLGAAVRATRTATFVSAKLGFSRPGADAFTGTVSVVDIGCPREVIDLASRDPGPAT